MVHRRIAKISLMQCALRSKPAVLLIRMTTAGISLLRKFAATFTFVYVSALLVMHSVSVLASSLHLLAAL